MKRAAQPGAEDEGGSTRKRKAVRGAQGAKTLEEMKSGQSRKPCQECNHREKTAAELGITRRTLLNKIKDYGIEQA